MFASKHLNADPDLEVEGECVSYHAVMEMQKGRAFRQTVCE